MKTLSSFVILKMLWLWLFGISLTIRDIISNFCNVKQSEMCINKGLYPPRIIRIRQNSLPIFQPRIDEHQPLAVTK